MSVENVEIVRHIYESGLIDRDPEELLKLATRPMLSTSILHKALEAAGSPS